MGIGGDVVALFSLLVSALDRKTLDLFRWDWWVMEGQLDGHLVEVDFDSSLRELFCVQALEAISQLQVDARDALNLPDDPEDVLRELRETAQRMLGGLEQWVPVLGAEAPTLLAHLLAKVDQALQRARERRITELVAAPVDEVRIQIFKESFLRGWRDVGVLRRVVSSASKIVTGGEAAPNLGYYGFNKLEQKEFFIHTYPGSIDDVGVDFGRAVGRAENGAVLDKILTSVETLTSPASDPESLLRTVDAAIGQIRAQEWTPTVFLTRSWVLANAIQASPHFVRDAASIELGNYRGCPVIRVDAPGRDIVLVADMGMIGTWRQYHPRQAFPPEDTVDVFTGFVRAVTPEFATQLLDSDAQLRRDPQTNAELGEREAVESLQQRVHIRLVEQFEFLVERPSAGKRVLAVGRSSAPSPTRAESAGPKQPNADGE
jgi:hypothetical protein